MKNKFLEYFQDNDHLILKSYSLIPENDDSLLFINAGMAPLKKFFLNLEAPPYHNLTTSQRCLRVGGKHNDLKDVGYTKRHHTFFEMLGNFSFGNYFKEKAISYAWEFITQYLNLDKSRLYVTVHPKDNDSKKFWETHISKNRIIELTNNIWSMGDIGPWGYCSEIFYDFKEGDGNFEEGDRYLEIWNLVFMEFCSDGQANFNLPKACIDTGMGLERIVAVLEGKNDTYDINFFHSQLDILNKKEHSPHTKIFLDHLRSSAWLIQEGIAPSSNERGYILRRILRRMLKAGIDLNIDNYEHTISKILKNWSSSYNYKLDIEKIIQSIMAEREMFISTYNQGLKYFHSFFDENKSLSADEIFILHDRHGFLEDLTRDLVIEKKGCADFDGFELLTEKHKNKNKLKFDYKETEYENTPILESRIIGIEDNFLILDRSCFYAEGGGQVGDSGIGVGSNFKIKIIDTKKNNKVFFHEFEKIEGDMKIGDTITLYLDVSRNNNIRVHHSCVHLVQHALDHLYHNVEQMGSYVSDKKFRLDFSWNFNEEIESEKIEEYIRTIINKNIATDIMYMPLNEAKATGAKAFFTYENTVRVVKIDKAIELCGGSHISNTKEILDIKITKIYSVKAGVKRIEGVAGKVYLEYLKVINNKFNEVLTYLNINQEQLMPFLRNRYKKENNDQELLFNEQIMDLNIGLVKSSTQCSIEEIISKFNLDAACFIVEKDGKITISIKVPKKFNAKQIASDISVYYSYKGFGGNNLFAQTGGLKLDNYEKIFEILKSHIIKFA